MSSYMSNKRGPQPPIGASPPTGIGTRSSWFKAELGSVYERVLPVGQAVIKQFTLIRGSPHGAETDCKRGSNSISTRHTLKRFIILSCSSVQVVLTCSTSKPSQAIIPISIDHTRYGSTLASVIRHWSPAQAGFVPVGSSFVPKYRKPATDEMGSPN